MFKFIQWEMNDNGGKLPERARKLLGAIMVRARAAVQPAAQSLQANMTGTRRQDSERGKSLIAIQHNLVHSQSVTWFANAWQMQLLTPAP